MRRPWEVCVNQGCAQEVYSAYPYSTGLCVLRGTFHYSEKQFVVLREKIY